MSLNSQDEFFSVFKMMMYLIVFIWVSGLLVLAGLGYTVADYFSHTEPTEIHSS